MSWGAAIKGLFGFARRRQENKHEQKRAQQDADANARKANTDQNMQEAKHDSKWVAGWRPFIGWICGFGFILYILVGVVPAFMIIFGYEFTQLQFDQLALIRSQLRTDVMEPLMYLLGGTYTLRSAEKLKGVARSGLISKVTGMFGGNKEEETPAMTKREKKKARKRNRKKR